MQNGWYAQLYSIRDHWIPFSQFSYADTFSARSRIVFTSPCHCWKWASVGLLLAVTVSVSSYVFHLCHLWKTLFPCSRLTPLAPTIVLCPLPHRSLNLEGSTLIMTSHIRDKFSWVSCLLQTALLWICVNSHLLWKDDCLTGIE